MKPDVGHSLFIVDNSITGWTGQRYLEEWASIARVLDIATGFFEIGSLLILDGKWQRLEKIRILMGAETDYRTRQMLLDSVRTQVMKILDQSLEDDKQGNPFLKGVPALREGLRNGQIECRIYDKVKFHAKTYITRPHKEVIGSQALVGSSNFTKPGLTQNIELNVLIQNGREVAQLQEWFETHWNQAQDITHAVLTTVERHVALYAPFDIYAKALQEFLRGHELTASEWDETRSRIFSHLDRYQKEAYWAAIKIARQHGGAFLCDGVGLGKTFVGLMLIERFILHEGKRVVLFAPKATKESVWEPHLRQWLPHIGGVGGGADFSNLAVFSHTDLSRKGTFPERFQRITELADVVIVDEAHHFRNPGSRGSDGKEPSRYYRLYDLLDTQIRSKTLFLFTATPINNRLSDFRHMVELFTRRDEAYFARTLGVNHLRVHFNQMERVIQQRVGYALFDASDQIAETQDVLATDAIFRQLVVQRSRAYARESQMRETGQTAMFPERMAPKVATYSIRKTYGRLLELFERAFTRENPLFTLPMYYPLHWYNGPDKDIDPFEQNRQQQVVGLIRTNFLKRFESSVIAFELSCDRLLKKLLAFAEVHSVTTSEKRRLARWQTQNAENIGYTMQHRFQFEEGEDTPEDEDIVPAELLDAVERFDRTEYAVEEMLSETFLDLDQIVQFLAEARKFTPQNDDKLLKIIRLLKSRELTHQKVLIFTEFADTARYLQSQLKNAGIDRVAEVDSASTGNRTDVIRRFSPYYNGSSSAELVCKGHEEIRVLISTDVLSEGLNLQDASRMINYDIHWNPVRLMQRIGRVDRRMDPAIEKRLIAAHPQVAAFRGKISYWNFLPPDELNTLLTLYTKVTQKTLLISETLGIEGRQLLTPEDDFDPLKNFNHAYEGTRTVIEDMHLEYQALLQSYPDLEIRLNHLPRSVFSGRTATESGLRGVFFCYALPAFSKETSEFTEEAGSTRWYFYDYGSNIIFEEPSEILDSIRTPTDTPRTCITDEKTLIDIRTKIDRHIKNTYLKRIDAPVGVKPILKCWMELNEG